MFAIYEHFPLWVEENGAARSLGSGLIIGALVLIAIFRKTVFAYLSEKFKGKNAPPIAIWVVLLICAYTLVYINSFLLDLITVLWMGLLGCGIGTGLNSIAEHKFGGKDGS
jgi:cobalamin synthase